MLTATPIPTRVREKDNAEMVYVPVGDFTMGNDQGYNGKIFADQRPEHPVDLDAFWIDKFEITNAKYQDCVAARECKAPDLGEDASRFNQDEQPVVRVSWFDAAAYCNWVGARLPTEAEWEKAARGTDKWLFPWGNEFDASKLNFKGQSDAPKPVGSFRDSASPYGALDMSGNVWEWTSSMYKNYPYKYQDGREDMSDEESATRVVRGGAWDEGDDQATTTWRSHFTQGSRFYNTGFRCASSAE
jgi:formylglycine-generating enzyme required for sulfatase activity